MEEELEKLRSLKSMLSKLQLNVEAVLDYSKIDEEHSERKLQ